MENAFKQILLPFDGSSQAIVALKSALFFAKKYNSKLCVIHIDEGISNNDIKAIINQNCDGFDYQFLHKSGRPYNGIIDASNEVDADLIIMGTHGISGFEEFWMGSTAYRVVSMAKCPVLTMRENAQHNNFKKIVLPIDTTIESRQKVPFAIKRAKQFDSTIHVLGVTVDLDVETERHLNVYLKQVKEKMEEAKIEYTIEKKVGSNITNSTIEHADKVNADLIIIMTEQEAQIGSFFLGKFAQQMVNHSTIPVISLSPRHDLNIVEARL